MGFLSEGASAENYINENIVGAHELSSHFFTPPGFDDDPQVFTIPAGELWEIVAADGTQDLSGGNDVLTNAGTLNLGTPGSPLTAGAIEFGAGVDRFINLEGATLAMLRGAEISMGGGNDYFTNYGTITTSGTIHGKGSTNRFENYGSFTATEAGSLEKWTSVDNYGSFSTAGLSSFADVGTFTNKAGGTFTINADLDFDSDGTADNGNFVNEGIFVITSGQKTISNILSFTNTNGVIDFALDYTNTTTPRLILTGSGFTGFTLNGGFITVSNTGLVVTPGATYHLIEIPLAVASVTETKLPYLDPFSAGEMAYSLAEIAVIGKDGDTNKSVLIVRSGTVPTAGTSADETITIEAHQTFSTSSNFALGDGVNIFNVNGGLILGGASIVGGAGVDTFNINAGAHAVLTTVGGIASKFVGGGGANVFNNAGTLTIHHASTINDVSTFNNNATGIININGNLTFSNTDFVTNAGTVNLNATWSTSQVIRFTHTGNIVVGAGAQRHLSNIATFTSTGKFTFSLDFDAPTSVPLLLTAYTTFTLTSGEIIIANADAITTPDADAVYHLIQVNIGLTEGVTALTVSEETATALGFGVGEIAIIDNPDGSTSSIIVLRNNPVFTPPATGTTGSDNVNIKSGLTWTLASDLDLLVENDSINNEGTITTSAAVTISNVETVNNAGVFNVNNALTFSDIDAFNNNAGGTLTLSANIDFGSAGARAFSNAGTLIVSGAQRTLTNVKSFTSSGAMTFTLDFTTANAHNTARLKLIGTDSFTISSGTITITNATATDRGSGAVDLTYRLIEIPLAMSGISNFVAPTIAGAAGVATGLGYTSSAEIDLAPGTGSITYLVLRPLSTVFTPPVPSSGVETVDVLLGQEWNVPSIGYDLESGADIINNEGTINVAAFLSLGPSDDAFNNKATGIVNISGSAGQITGAGGTDSLTNEGAINILASATQSQQFGSFATITNSGTITTNRALGISSLNTFTNSGTFTLNGNFSLGDFGTRSFVNTGTIALGAGPITFTNVKSFSSTGGVFSFTLPTASSQAATARLKFVGTTSISIDGGTITVSNAAASVSGINPRTTYTLIEIPIAFTFTTAPTLDAETMAILGYYNPQIVVKAGSGTTSLIVLQENKIAQPTFTGGDNELTIPLGQTWDTELTTPDTEGGDDTIIVKGALAVFSTLDLGADEDSIIVEEGGVFALENVLYGGTGNDKLINRGEVDTRYGLVQGTNPEFRDFETIENYGTFTVFEERANSVADALRFKNFDTFINMASGNLILHDDLLFLGTGLHSLDSKGRITVGPKPV
ncbi:MAG: beta strand repeat-containing protein, partial [Parvibaculales bacterium]